MRMSQIAHRLRVARWSRIASRAPLERAQLLALYCNRMK